MKVCKRCLDTKSLSDFYGQNRNSDGLRPYCKECDKKRNRDFYDKNKVKIKIGRLSKD